MSRVCIIGLDCLAPQLVFDKHDWHLPNLRALAKSGFASPLLSCDPPITVPAWASMVTGVDPGSLGLYGFYDRASRRYDDRRLASSASFDTPTLWSILSTANYRSLVIGVPPTYPPLPLAGVLVSDFLTPTTAQTFTYPADIQDDVQELTAGYIFDVADFRQRPPDEVLASLYTMMSKRFRLAREFVTRESWDFFMMVEMASDRLHHAFWQYAASENSKPHLQTAIREFYEQIDVEVGALVSLLDTGDIVMVVSDHGAQTCKGGIALNDWLINEGYLVLHEGACRTASPLVPAMVDWSRTRAWGDGGYCGRIHLNIAHREPHGIVTVETANGLLAELKRKLSAIRSPEGAPLDTHCYEPHELYREVRGVAPDLTIYFDNLAYRALGTIGHATLHVAKEDDSSLDGANHDRFGVLIMKQLGVDSHLSQTTWRVPSIYDIAPTVLHRLGVEIPAYMRGQILEMQ